MGQNNFAALQNVNSFGTLEYFFNLSKLFAHSERGGEGNGEHKSLKQIEIRSRTVEGCKSFYFIFWKIYFLPFYTLFIQFILFCWMLVEEHVQEGLWEGFTPPLKGLLPPPPPPLRSQGLLWDTGKPGSLESKHVPNSVNEQMNSKQREWRESDYTERERERDG